MKIAVVAIIKNEEAMLEKMLKSCKDLPVFVIDTGSNDGSYDLYIKYNITWKKYSRWDDCQGTAEDFSFAEARNEAFELARDYEWRVILDADEYLEGNFVKDLKALVKNDWMSHYNIIGVRVETDSEVLESPRVLRNIPEIFYEDAVHNRIAYTEQNKDKAYMSGLRLRSGFSPNHKTDPDRTIRLLKKGINDKPDNARYYYYLAREYMIRYGNLKNSLKEENKDRVMAQMFPLLFTMVGLLEHHVYLTLGTNEKADSYVLLGIFYMEMNNHHQARRCAWAAIEIIPTLEEAWQIIRKLGVPKFYEFYDKVISIADNDGALTVRKNG